ncbi:unnamed protein product [Ixodes persulcatus]
MAADNDVRLIERLRVVIGEAKNLPPRSHGAVEERDVYCAIKLDQEEIFRTTTREKTLNPFFSEDFQFEVPREFRQLSVYVAERERASNKDKVLGKVSIKKEGMHKYYGKDNWFPIMPVDADSEVQGKAHISVRLEPSTKSSIYGPCAKLSVRVTECSDLNLVNGSCNPYALVTLCHGLVKQETRKSKVRRKTVCPRFEDAFYFDLKPQRSDKQIRSIRDEFSNLELSLSMQNEITGVTQIAMSATAFSAYRIYSQNEHTFFSEILMQSWGGAFITQSKIFASVFTRIMNGPFIPKNRRNFLSPCKTKLQCEKKKGFFSCFFSCFRVFLGFSSRLSQVVLFAHAAHAFATSLHQDAKVGSFRGLLAFLSKVRGGGEGRMPSLCALCLGEGFSAFLSYLLTRDVRPRDQTALCRKRKKKGLLFMLGMLRLGVYADKHHQSFAPSNIIHHVEMRSIFFFSLGSVDFFFFFPPFASCFVSLCLGEGFSASLSYLLARGARPKDEQSHRSLTLVSKSIQTLGNLVSSTAAQPFYKEDYMKEFYENFITEEHKESVRQYLELISLKNVPMRNLDTPSIVLKEGIMTKRAQGRNKLGLKNFKRRYFCLTTKELYYSKTKDSSPLCTIPLYEILGVEKVQEDSFKMKNVFQVIQKCRALYIQANNCVEEKEWRTILTRICHFNLCRIHTYHPAAFLKGHWLCCKEESETAPGCSPVTSYNLADIKVTIDTDREMQRVHSIFLNQMPTLERLIETCRQQLGSGASTCPGVEMRLPPGFVLDDPQSLLSTLSSIKTFVESMEVKHERHRHNLYRQTRYGSKQAPIGDDNYLLMFARQQQQQQQQQKLASNSSSLARPLTSDLHIPPFPGSANGFSTAS